MKYFLSAGEASGDLHGSELITRLREADTEAEFSFLGGDMMSRAAGREPIIDYRRMAFMGFSEVLRNLRTVFSNLSVAKRAIDSERPDALILIDYPSFNLKLARHAHKLGIPVYYYISPKVWAWKEYRVKDIKRYVDRVLSILPFEEDFFARHDYCAEYVGNPSVEEIDRRIAALNREPGRFGDGRPVLALVPGSRRGEIRNNLPVMAEVARRFPEYCPVVAGAPGIDRAFYDLYADGMEVVEGQTFNLMANAAAALVTSGTATLECALLGTPQVVCYRANGSKISYNIFKRILKIPYVSLPNLIAGSEIVHEALVHLCTPDLVARELAAVLPGGSRRQAQLDGYALMRSRLGSREAAPTAASIIVSSLRPDLSRQPVTGWCPKISHESLEST